MPLCQTYKTSCILCKGKKSKPVQLCILKWILSVYKVVLDSLMFIMLILDMILKMYQHTKLFLK